MDYLSAVILGLVEGLTEFLPISSTAHLILASRVLGVPESEFLASFIIAIQLGAIASVVFLYWRVLVFDWEVGKRIFVAFIPTALVGFVLYQVLKDYLLENLTIIACALFLGGVVIILFERWQTGVSARATPLSTMPYWKAVLIGLAQSLAIVPGVSRAGATILGGLSLGMARADIVMFSFLLAIPTMLAATGYDLLKSASAFDSGDWGHLAVGFVVSFFAAYAAIRWLIKYVQTHTFTAFGWYRIALGALILILLYV